MGFFSWVSKKTPSGEEEKSKKGKKDAKQQAAKTVPVSGTITPARSRATSVNVDNAPRSASYGGPRNSFGKGINIQGAAYTVNESPYGRSAPATSEPVPQLSPGKLQKYQQRSQLSSSPRSKTLGQPQQKQASSFDSNILGNPKMQAAARDRGYVNTHLSGDSGYASSEGASRLQSRTPSARNVHSERPIPNVARNEDGYFPPTTFTEMVMRERAFSRTSLDDGEVTTPKAETYKPTSRVVDQTAEAQAPAMHTRLRPSTKTKKSTTKHARFEDEISATAFEPRQPPSKSSPMAELQSYQWTGTATNDAGMNSPAADSGSREVSQEEERTPMASPVPQRPAQVAQPQLGHGNRRRSDSLPPLVILDGLKVNRRGKVLDEEGEMIGELVEGDIIDCVRQKVNGRGEVLDEFGRYVGRVRTLPRGYTEEQQFTPLSEMSPHAGNQQNYRFSPQMTGLRPSISNGSAFSELERQHFNSRHMQNRMEMLPPPQFSNLPHLPYSKPLDLPEDIGTIELDASEPVQPVHIEPVFDMSEPFIPGSWGRSISPSPMLPSSDEMTAEREARTPSLTEGSDTSAESVRNAPEQVYVAPTKTDFSRPSPARFQDNASLDMLTGSDANIEHAKELSNTTTLEQTKTVQLAEEKVTQQQKTSQKPSPRPSVRARTISESSTTSLRVPSMSSVPETAALENDIPTDRPELFSYKGEIPANDGPPPGVRLAVSRPVSTKPPPLPAFPRQAFTSGLPAGSPFAPNNSSHSAAGPNRRLTMGNMPQHRATLAVPMRPGLKNRYSSSGNMPLVRSPLSNHGMTMSSIADSLEAGAGVSDVRARPESAGRDSDQSSNHSGPSVEETPSLFSNNNSSGHVRTPSRPNSIRSVRTTHSSRTVNSINRPRTYFTHQGRVTVQPGELPPSAFKPKPISMPKPPPTPEEVKVAKKMRRFTISFGGKKEAGIDGVAVR